MIVPFLKNEMLLDNIRGKNPDSKHFDVWWLGQSGFLIHWQGHHLLLDPYLSDSLTMKYAETDKPHIRMTELVVDPAKLDFIDVVTSSHNHTDHLDAETLKPLLDVNRDLKMIIPEANRSFVAQRLDCDIDFPLGLNDDQQLRVGAFTFHGIPAAHNEVARDSLGRCLYMGYVVTFGPWTIYHSGDTLWFDGLENLLEPFQIDMAFLPINGNKPERRVAGNLDCTEAVQLGLQIKAKLVIPCHYDMFTFNTADPDEFARIASDLGQPFKVLRGGESWCSEALVS
ncbi:MAG: MBL fold metallo-hydrolase [Saprospiraceae bacterium]|nr:MBL fold metallo-hydrolase [Saprospiraceae bacterium]